MFQESEYFKFIKAEKSYIDKEFTFPAKDESIILEAKDDNNIEYIVDINRKRAILTRCTYQNRYATSIILLRLDIDTKPHRNPNDNKVISGNHIHVYTEKYGSAYALELDDPILKEINPEFDLNRFNLETKNENRLYEYFEAFSDFCNIKNIPNYQHSI